MQFLTTSNSMWLKNLNALKFIFNRAEFLTYITENTKNTEGVQNIYTIF